MQSKTVYDITEDEQEVYDEAWITSHRTAHTRQQKSHLEHHYSNNMAAFQLTVTGVRNAIIEDIPSDTMKREK